MAGFYSQSFIRAVNFTLQPDVEGAGIVSNDRKDPGNWTGGVVGKGEFKGTKWGLSAAAYPTMDIPAITREQATGVYWRDFWSKIQGDLMGPRIAMCVFDSAVNQGVEGAVRILQRALTLPADGIMGPATVSAIRSVDQDVAIVTFMRERMLAYTRDKGFPQEGKGWFGRCVRLTMDASR